MLNCVWINPNRFENDYKSVNPLPHHPQPLRVFKFCTVYSLCILVPFFCLNIALRNRVRILALHDSCIEILFLCAFWLCFVSCRIQLSWDKQCKRGKPWKNRVDINVLVNLNTERTEKFKTPCSVIRKFSNFSSKIYHSFPWNFLKVHILAEKLHTDVDNFVRERERRTTGQQTRSHCVDAIVRVSSDCPSVCHTSSPAFTLASNFSRNSMKSFLLT